MFKKTFQIVKQVFSILTDRSKKKYDQSSELENRAQETSNLEEKSHQLDEYSQSERENRIFLSRVVDAQDMMLLRREEELKRKEANCRFSQEKWKRLKKKKLQKDLLCYFESQRQKNY